MNENINVEDVKKRRMRYSIEREKDIEDARE